MTPRSTLFDQALERALGFDSRPFAKRGNHTLAQNDEPRDKLTAAQLEEIDREFGIVPRPVDAEAVREHHEDEIRSGLEDLPTARMERENPERWAE